MKKRYVYVVIARTYTDTEVLAVYGNRQGAIIHRNTEQENYRATGADTEVQVEKWEVFS